MDITMNRTRGSRTPFKSLKKAGTSAKIESKPFKGIEVDLFSYNIAPTRFQQVIEEVCGNHFEVKMVSEENEEYSKFYIAPKDYCLVEGGMMYSSAGSIISELISTGFLIKGYLTVEK